MNSIEQILRELMEEYQPVTPADIAHLEKANRALLDDSEFNEEFAAAMAEEARLGAVFPD